MEEREKIKIQEYNHCEPTNRREEELQGKLTKKTKQKNNKKKKST